MVFGKSFCIIISERNVWRRFYAFLSTFGGKDGNEKRALWLVSQANRTPFGAKHEPFPKAV
ncbi:hypothetical protein SalAn1F4_11080 [Streptococcus alactolyticus]|nr:hypothetical protein SalAn1F4_11080 [Streptococcus alactolyticus]